MAARRRFRWIVLVIGVAAIAIILWVVLHKRPAPKPQPPAIPVTTAAVKTDDVPLAVTALGSAQAWRSDNILAQVSGKLLSVPFVEGSYVRKGALLAQVDPAPYRAVLMQAEGALVRDRALLANARVDLARYQKLAAQDSISRQMRDTQIALVNQDEGTVMIDEGQVAAAKVNLAYTRITAPISGRVGVRLVDPGNVVTGSAPTASLSTTTTASASGISGSTTTSSTGTGIAIVNQIEPIAVTFTVPQGDFQRISNVSEGFRKPLAVVATSQDTGDMLGEGSLTIADNRVDPATGAVVLKARFPNADHHLWPGQFVNVRLTLQTLVGVTTIPASAVNQGPKGAFAYVVGAGSVATIRPLKVAATQGDIAIIASGVKPGETVVVDGQMILKAGSKVRTATPQAPAARSAS
jgi:multidrug efflux system membrane fusion protein